jgi:hypothetical protein
VRISVTDGATLKGASGLQATLGVDLSVRDVNDNRNFGGRDEGPSRGNKRGGED